MKRQKRQMLLLVLLLLLMLAAYAGVRLYNQEQEKKEAAAEAGIRVLELTSEEIIEFSFLSEGTPLSFSKEEENWSCEADPSIDLDETMLQTMLDTVAALEASEEIIVSEELSEYGLEKPQNTITLTTAEESITLYLGNKNEITGDYYLKREGSDSIYLVDDSLATYFSYTLEELQEIEQE